MRICEEMAKLRDALTKRGISWIDKSDIKSEDEIQKVMQFGIAREYADTSIFRTHFEINGNLWSVINGYATYGGYDPFTGINEGLLECMVSCIDSGEPVGCLTAEKVMQMIEQQLTDKEDKP